VEEFLGRVVVSTTRRSSYAEPDRTGPERLPLLDPWGFASRQRDGTASFSALVAPDRTGRPLFLRSSGWGLGLHYTTGSESELVYVRHLEEETEEALQRRGTPQSSSVRSRFVCQRERRVRPVRAHPIRRVGTGTEIASRHRRRPWPSTFLAQVISVGMGTPDSKKLPFRGKHRGQDRHEDQAWQCNSGPGNL
jgi:hypothetical protein